MNNFITRSVGLLLISILLTGCLDKYNRGIYADCILINETDVNLHMSYYYWVRESQTEISEWQETIAAKDSFYLYRGKIWNPKYLDESTAWKKLILGYPREDTRIIFSDDSGTTVAVWYAKDADSQPGNFFRQDSWDYEKGPHYEPYSDGVPNNQQIVWTYHIRKNQ